jgi:Fe-S-cluster containining protein
MKYVDIKDVENLPGKMLGDDETFSFQCHSGLSCFNQCCRNLKMFLYPYDVLRLKNHLGISSDAFIDQYVDVVLREDAFFPEVMLRMSQDKEKTCLFLIESGCSVYSDRPDTCRTFPIEQGSLYDAKSQTTKSVYFFRPPDFCLGQHEEKIWSPETWSEDQDAFLYNKMTMKWSELKRLFQNNPWGHEGPEGAKAKMAFMAIYNVDQFRGFVLNSSFLKRYKVKSELVKKFKRDDVKLMTFGFEWVKFYLWGIKSTSFKLRKS